MTSNDISLLWVCKGRLNDAVVSATARLYYNCKEAVGRTVSRGKSPHINAYMSLV